MRPPFSNYNDTNRKGGLTMSLFRKASKIVYAVVFGRLILSYLDPGTGSLIIQLLLGVLLSTLFFVKVFWGKIKAVFRRSDKSTDEPL
jgi:hypothetical protein